jgi:MFS family permease
MNQLNLLYLTALLMDMAVAGLVFAIGRRAAELGASATQLGLLGSLWFGAYTALTLVTGRVSDRVGRRQVAVTGCVVAGAFALACAYTTNVGVLLALTVLFGAGVAGFWPSVIAWLSEGAHGARLAGRLTRFSVAWNIGLLLGFGIAGELYRHGLRLGRIRECRRDSGHYTAQRQRVSQDSVVGEFRGELRAGGGGRAVSAVGDASRH